MTIRMVWTFLVPLGMLASGGLQAQDAAQSPQPTQPANQVRDSRVTTAVNNNVAFDAAVLGLLAPTHGNTLGVEVAPPDEPLRAQLAIDPDTGVVVTSIAADSAALKGGLKQHDVILKLGDEPVSSPERFHHLVGSRQGQEVVFHLLRQGQPADVTLTLPDLPVWSIDFAVPATTDSHYRIGVTLAEADDTLRTQLNLAAGEGLVVTDVVADGPAAKAGLQRHDVLVKLDNQRLTTVEKVNSLIQDIKDRQVTVVLLRGGKEDSREIAPRLSNDPSRVFLGTRLDYNYYPDLRTFMVQPNPSTSAAADELLLNFIWTPESITDQPATAAGQITRLKQQLADLQSTVQALESALQAAPAEKQPETPPQSEAPEQPQDQ